MRSVFLRSGDVDHRRERDGNSSELHLFSYPVFNIGSVVPWGRGIAVSFRSVAASLTAEPRCRLMSFDSMLSVPPALLPVFHLR